MRRPFRWDRTLWLPRARLLRSIGAIALAWCSFVLPAATALAAEAAAGRDRPNIVVILADDVGEAKNLAAEHPERVRDLRAAWERWNAELKDPLPEFSR